MKLLAPMSTTNNKQSPTPSQLHIIPHPEVLFTLFPVIPYMMPGFQQNITRYAKRQGKTQSKETKASEPDSGMMQGLEWWDKKFKMTMIHTLRTLAEKVDNIQDKWEMFVNKWKCKEESRGNAWNQKCSHKKSGILVMGSSVDWTWLGKVSVSLEISQKKLLKLKGKGKR